MTAMLISSAMNSAKPLSYRKNLHASWSIDPGKKQRYEFNT
jgi:hypothetical protein